MKKIIVLISLFVPLCLLAATHIEVYYLTANAYCPSVEEIEHETQTVLENEFKQQLTDSTIVTKKFNIFDPSWQDFTRKWEISTNGIMLLAYENGEPRKIDLNEIAFSNVPSDVDNYRKTIKDTIYKLLLQKPQAR